MLLESCEGPSAFHEAPSTGQSSSLQSTVSPSPLFWGLQACPASAFLLHVFPIPLFFYLFYFYGLSFIICFPQALFFDSLETILEIKNKYPKLTSPQGNVLASGWLGGKSQFRGKTQIFQKLISLHSSLIINKYLWNEWIVGWNRKEYQGFGRGSIFQI